MKRFSMIMTTMVSIWFLSGCGSTEYIISTNDGTMIPTQGKPKLDEDTGMYSYEDAEGRDASISKDKVKQIMER